jgi:hypothetical protein
MLEKTLGITLVTKLRAILLMEADFNATNKIVYGNLMFTNARKHNLISEEIFSEKNWMANKGTLCKTLFYDITRQARVPAAIASIDASNCYDRIAHTMASLVLQAFGVLITAVESTLGAIENMKFFLCMGFGDLTSFCGGWHKHKDARIVSREWGLTGRMGGHQHLHPKVTWQERAWCKICMPNNQTGKTLISNPLCG